MGRLFGTDGVRGIANSELTPLMAFEIGKAAAYVLTKQAQRKPKILIGKDTRISGDMLEAALCAGICSVGAVAITLGILPTPAIAYLTRKYEADAGVVISASHNSAEYNGIKIFNSNGYKLSDALEERIEKMVLDNAECISMPTGDAVGTVTKCDTALADYVEFAKSTIKTDLKGMKIAVDCANGASYKTAVKVIVDLGAEAYVVHNHPNGTNINLNCGSTHTRAFCEYVKNINVDIGITFDGDGDRLLVVDEKGNIIDGDKIMFICAEDLKQRGLLMKDTLVTTVMTNLGLILAAKEKGIHIVQTKVGDRYVLEEMLSSGYILGGEASGHIIFLNHNTTGDGLISALQILKIMKKTGKKMSQLAKVFKALPQVTVNARVQNQNKYLYENDAVIMNEVESIEKQFKDRGRVLVRASGTEPCIRVMIEGEDQSVIEERANGLAKIIEARLN